MKKLVSLVLGFVFLVSLSGIAFASEGEKEAIQKQQINGYEIQLITPDPLAQGEKEVEVKILKDGAPVSVPVKLTAEMDKSDDSMSMDMDKEEAKETEMTESGQGEYSAHLDFDGAGKWIVTVTFGDVEKATFEVSVEKSGPNWVVVGGFVGVILLIVIIAAVMRKKEDTKGGDAGVIKD